MEDKKRIVLSNALISTTMRGIDDIYLGTVFLVEILSLTMELEHAYISTSMLAISVGLHK